MSASTDQSERIVRSMTVMQCEECLSRVHIPSELNKDVVPCVLECPHCHGLHAFAIVPIIPKVAPAVGLRNFKLYANTTLTEFRAYRAEVEQRSLDQEINKALAEEFSEARGDTPENSQIDPVPVDSVPVPFFTHAKLLGEIVNQTFSQIADLQKDIEKFTQSIGAFFQKQWHLANKFREQWSPQYLNEFLDLPFTACQIDCENELANKYARFVLAPKFFNPGLGIKVAGKGGMRMEIMTQYTRMNIEFPVEILTALELPPSLDLRIAGNKIIGGSLPYCYKDIPGTIEDIDSTLRMPSITIKNKPAARLWLAAHGVPPIAQHELNETDLYTKKIDPMVSEHAGFLTAWKKFAKHGRVAIFWDSARNARTFASLAARMIKGVKCIFVASEYEKMAWKNLYSTTNINRHPNATDHAYNDSINHVFMSNKDYVSWERVMRTKMCIIDLHVARHSSDETMQRQLDSTVLDRMLDYDGLLIVIGDDPLLDFSKENFRANRIHALAPWQLYEEGSWERWPESKLKVDLLRQMLRKSDGDDVLVLEK